MKIRLLLALVGWAIGFASPTFSQQENTVDPKTAQEIRSLATKYDEAFNKQDPAAVAALYTEDAVYVAHHGTFHGPQAIEKRMQTISSIGIAPTMSLRSIG
jgi:ketosteroid isomerase-like protein